MTTIFEKLAGIAAKCAAPKPTTLVARQDSEATVYVYDAITPDGMGGVSAKSFAEALNEAKGAKTLNVRINCVGGVIYEAKAIYNTLRNFPGRKVVHVDGLCASAATFIAMAADEIVTAPEATWFIHGAQGMTMGDASTHRAAADLLDMESALICSIYAKRTGQTEADLRALMDKETFMTAQEALDLGFTDSIEGEEPKSKRMTASAPATHKVVATAAETQRQLRAAKINIRLTKEQRRNGQP